MGLNDVFRLLVDDYRPHALHGSDADWAETNCYVDVWVALLSSLGLEPLACLSFTLCSDFEGDQWTFFKPPAADLRRLYGIQVEELSLWNSVLDHCEQHLRRRNIPLVEADSFYLPDTRATDYRQNHVKTTIAPVFIDRAARKMRYFHNAAFGELSETDFEGLFRRVPAKGSEQDITSGKPHWLPPFCEVIKLERAVRLSDEELLEVSTALAKEHYAWRPQQNPFLRLLEAWPSHLESLLEGGLETYHAYTFSTLRQCGANYAMLAAYLNWQGSAAGNGIEELAAPFHAISQTCKTVLMKLARVVHSKKPRDFTPQFEQAAESWQSGMDALGRALGD